MFSMKRCHHCDGFIPSLKFQCPNCDRVSKFQFAPRAMKTFVTLVAGSAVAMTLSACYGSPVANPSYYNDDSCQVPGSVDYDGDGFCELDCDDTDENVNPWAYDVPGDEVDQDCDGTDAEPQASP